MTEPFGSSRGTFRGIDVATAYLFVTTPAAA
jgi:hypothetical protein